MPATAIDTFFACSLLVIVVVSAMAVMPRVMYPVMDGLAHQNDNERLQQLSQYILLNPGAPTTWGNNPAIVPSDFGLAADDTKPYSLDVDKVTRLNSKNNHAINYAQVIDALKVSNIAMKISVKLIYDTTIALISSLNDGSVTQYGFEISTESSGFMVASDVSSYFIVRDYVAKTVVSADSGRANASFTISNSLNGSALLAVFARAKADPNAVSFGVYSLGHNASAPEPNETFMHLSPSSNVLNVSTIFSNEQISRAYAFSYSYWASLTQVSNGTQTREYTFPDFLDKSPTILVFTGFNDTRSFSEWVAYPQVPLDLGVNFDSSTSSGSVASFNYIVMINGAEYALQMKLREVD